MKTKINHQTFKSVAAIVALFAISFLTVAAAPPKAQNKGTGPGALPPALSVADRDVDTSDQVSSKPGEPAPLEAALPPSSPDLITASTYTFTSANGVALESMASGTTQLVQGNVDDTASIIFNIGFDFFFDGFRFTQFSVNANGECRLGPTQIATTFTNSLATTTDQPKICPYWDDLWTGTDGKVHFKVVGSAPNRKLVVEWQNEQIPRVGNGFSGAGTFQMWLFETTGVIEFVYGSGIVANTVNGGYSVGIQSNGATNFASVTTATDTVSYATADNAQTTAIPAGKAYLFTPNVPATPGAAAFTGITPTSLTVNWVDNATNEVGYLVYRQEGANFVLATQAAAGSTSFIDTGLAPGTVYTYNVYAFSEGALSAVLPLVQATATGGAISSTAAGGNWSSAATWAGGIVPTDTDNVTIVGGATVTIDSSSALSITVANGGILQFEDAVARTLTVGGSVTINAGGTFRTQNLGTVTTHILGLGGNLTNNGTLDFSTNADTAGAEIIFSPSQANVTFGGTGGTTDVRGITVAKGGPTRTVELNPTNFSVRGVGTDVAGYLTLTNGIFKISGTFVMANRTFIGPTYIIPATGGIWLNNPNYTVAATASAATTANSGLLRVTTGIYNIGIGAGDQMRGNTGAIFTFEGGTTNVSGAFDPQSAVIYTQTGGTLNVGTVGNNVSNFGTFELFSTSVLGSFTMSGGTINIVNPSTGATKVDYRNNTPTSNHQYHGWFDCDRRGAAPAERHLQCAGPDAEHHDPCHPDHAGK